MTAVLSSLRRFFTDRLSLDLRSLALFRIGIALFLLGDLAVRAQDLVAHYTDFGTLPRGAYLEQLSNQWYLSFHLAGGTAAFEALMFLLAASFALCLLVGYRTRLFTVLSWIMLISLQSRNPMILQGGDFLAHMSVFWGMFLPLGGAYSVDSALNTAQKEPPERFFSVATIAFYLQIAFCYWFSVLYKSGTEWWPEGTAAYYALSADHFLTASGQWLLATAPVWLLRLGTYGVLLLEILGPIGLMITSQLRSWRIWAVLSIVFLHLSFRFSLDLGIFPWIGIVSVLPFLPSWLWDRLQERLDTKDRRALVLYYDGSCGFCERTVKILRSFLLLPQAKMKPAQNVASIKRLMKKSNSWILVNRRKQRFTSWEALVELTRHSPLLGFLAPIMRFWPFHQLGTRGYQWVANHRPFLGYKTRFLAPRPLSFRRSWMGGILAAFFITYIFFWNLGDLNTSYARGVPPSLAWIGHTLRIDQQWNMFAPFPMKDDGWWVMPGKLRDGTDIDVFTGRIPPSYKKPERVAELYLNGRWRKYMRNLSKGPNDPYRLYFGRYICRKWNTENSYQQHLLSFDMVFMKEMTLPDYQKPSVVREVLWKHECF